MRWCGQRAGTGRHRRARAVWLTSPLAVIALVAGLWSIVAAAPASGTLSALVTNPAGRTSAIGALFSTSGGQLRTHFCTASVVHSPAGDLLVTAAHCVTGYSDTSPAGLAFVPGYDNGYAPYGIWPVARVFVDSAWESTANPDDDFAFLTVAQPGSSTPIEDVTGAERLGIGQPSTDIVQVTGYPDGLDQQVTCRNRASAFSSTQMQFDCDGYTDGTSGSPFLVHGDTASGESTVIGVIGGYQRGGGSPDVSYAATFGENVQALYGIAVSSAHSGS
jgi:V8-like Glu-specific endopeptidase